MTRSSTTGWCGQDNVRNRDPRGHRSPWTKNGGVVVHRRQRGALSRSHQSNCVRPDNTKGVGLFVDTSTPGRPQREHRTRRPHPPNVAAGLCGCRAAHHLGGGAELAKSIGTQNDKWITVRRHTPGQSILSSATTPRAGSADIMEVSAARPGRREPINRRTSPRSTKGWR